MDQAAPNKRRTQFWIGILVSLVCLGAIFIFIKPADIIASLKDARIDRLLVTGLTIVLFLLLRAVRWRFMLQGGYAKKRPVPYQTVFHIQNIGYMLGNILPFRLGDVARAVLIGNVPPVTISLGLSTMVTERIFDLLLMIAIFPFALVATSELPPEIETAVRLVGFLAIFAAAVLIVAANQRSWAMSIVTKILNRVKFLDTPRWSRRFDDLLKGLETLTNWKDGLTLLVLSVVVWLPIFASYYFGMQGLNMQPTIAETVFVVCIAAFSIAAPSSPGQIGVFEAGVTFALATLLGMPKAQAASFAFIYHAINYLVLGILGVIGIFSIGSTFQNILDTTRSFVNLRSEKSGIPNEKA
jgi:uncharacterized protein (TIRG00374 family)